MVTVPESLFNKVAGQNVSNRYEALMTTLHAISFRKREPAIQAVRDFLVNPTTVATICFLKDVLHLTNIIQKALQGYKLNFLKARS